MTTNLVQLLHIPDKTRRVALVEEPNLHLLTGADSVYELAQQCLAKGEGLAAYARSLAAGTTLLYDEVYTRISPWRVLSPIDVPGEPSRVLVAGTGLTHIGSASQRQAMHLAGQSAQDRQPEVLTDSMRMFQWGVQQGRPSPGQAGIAPEWFYKGDASVLRAPFDPLEIPWHAEDGGEEAEIAGIYLIASDGTPYRLGMCNGNEFSDHKFERRNYLNLAGSKLRACSLGPELVVDAPFADVHGSVRIERNGATLWEKAIASGEDNMAHSLANLEHHHFKFSGHRQPGTVHIHFFGADSLSFGAGLTLEEGDIAEVCFEGFGRALRNPIHEEAKGDAAVTVRTL
jgi:hypothetical protein